MNAFTILNKNIPNQNSMHSIAFLPWLSTKQTCFGPPDSENASVFHKSDVETSLI